MWWHSMTFLSFTFKHWTRWGVSLTIFVDVVDCCWRGLKIFYFSKNYWLTWHVQQFLLTWTSEWSIHALTNTSTHDVEILSMWVQPTNEICVRKWVCEWERVQSASVCECVCKGKESGVFLYCGGEREEERVCEKERERAGWKYRGAPQTEMHLKKILQTWSDFFVFIQFEKN